MKKEIPKLMSALVILGFLIPQVTFAAWWNPMSWVKSRPPAPETEVVGPQVDQKESAAEQKLDPPPKNNADSDSALSDSKLQLQINSLIKENSDLRKKLIDQSTLTQQLNQCRIDLSKVNTSPTLNAGKEIIASDCLAAQKRYKNASDAIESAIESKVSQLKEEYAVLIAKQERAKEIGNASPSLYEGRIEKLKQELDSKVKEIRGKFSSEYYLEQNTALKDIEAYCR